MLGFKTLKSALKAAGREDEATDVAGADETVLQIPSDWPLRPLVSGKRVVIVGGDPRPEATARIADAFGFASLVWEETNTRRVHAVAERIRSGTVDVALLLRRFIAHKEMDLLVDACKAAGVPYVAVDAGYGVGQIRLAFERYLSHRLQAPQNNGS